MGNDKITVRIVSLALALLAGLALLCGTWLLAQAFGLPADRQAAAFAATGVVFAFATGATGGLGALLASTRSGSSEGITYTQSIGGEVPPGVTLPSPTIGL